MDIPSNEAFISTLEREIVAQLKTHKLLSGVPIFLAADLDLEAQLAQAMAKLGVAIVVRRGPRTVANPGALPIRWKDQHFVFECGEDFFMNRAPSGQQTPADAVADAVCEALTAFRASCLGGNSLLKPGSPTIKEAGDDERLVNEVTYIAQ